MQLPLRTKRFDEAQVLVQGPDCDGRRELIAVCTGPLAQQHADAIVRAVNDYEALLAACNLLIRSADNEDFEIEEGGRGLYTAIDLARAAIDKATQ